MTESKHKNRRRTWFLLLAMLMLGGFFYYNFYGPGEGKEQTTRLLDAHEVEFKGQYFDIVKYTPGQGELQLYWKDENGEAYGGFTRLKESLESEGKELLFATNAGIFSENHTPGGLHIEDGETLKNLNLRRGSGNFHMFPNGVFYLGAEGANVMESNQYKQDHPQSNIGTQSGPMLVIEDQLHPAFNEGSRNKHIRNGVGVDEDGNIYFAISQKPVNFFDFASLFRDELHCPNALYLDGTISGFYAPELGRYDNGGDYCGILAITR